MAKKKPSGGSGCFPLVGLVCLCAIVFSMCGGGSDDPTTPTPQPSAPTITTTAPSSPTIETTIVPTTNPTSEPTVPTSIPTEPEQSAQIVFIDYPESIKRGSTATVKIKGKPNTKYSITVYYKSGPSKAEGLETKTSDANGYVTWTWQIGGRTSPGTFEITVSGYGVSESVNFTITK